MASKNCAIVDERHQAIKANVPEFEDSSVVRSPSSVAVVGAGDCQELADLFLAAPVLRDPYSGPLLAAARTVLAIYDGDIGISDEHAQPVIEARRIIYGPTDGFVAAETLAEASRLKNLRVGSSEDHEEGSDETSRPHPMSVEDAELGAGLRLLGRLAIHGKALPTSGHVTEANGSTVACSNDTASAASVVPPPVLVPPSPPTPAVTNPEVVALSVSKFAVRWDHCKRQIEKYIRQGLPKHGEGRQRRIVVAEGDEWMRLYRDPLARSALQTAQRHSRSRERVSENARA